MLCQFSREDKGEAGGGLLTFDPRPLYLQCVAGNTPTYLPASSPVGLCLQRQREKERKSYWESFTFLIQFYTLQVEVWDGYSQLLSPATLSIRKSGVMCIVCL